MGTPSMLPWPSGWNKLGKAGNIAAARQELAEAAEEDHHRQRDENRMGAGIGDHRPHDQAAGSAHCNRQDRSRCRNADARVGPAMACSTQARVSPQMLAVNVTARLSPPEMIGISIARVSRPSSGN